jgi:hypothetical protein
VCGGDLGGIVGEHADNAWKHGAQDNRRAPVVPWGCGACREAGGRSGGSLCGVA